MAATNYAVLVPRVQILANDTPTSNPHFGETPAGLRDGTNKTFRLAFQNPVAASIFFTYGASIIRQPAGSATFQVLDLPSGYLTVTPAAVAPDNGATQPMAFDYFSQLFSQSDYQTMLDEGTEWLGGVAGVDVAEGLYPAQVRYALSVFYNRRASDKAKEYASSGGGIGAQPQTPAQAFTNLAKSALAQAVTLRDDYYKRQGQRNAPASGTIHYGISSNQSPY